MIQKFFNFYNVARQKIIVTSKLCPVCQTDKPATEFYSMAASRDGLAGKCKICQAAYAVERHKRLYQDPAYRTTQCLKVRQCQKAHPSKTRALQRAYMHSNPAARIRRRLSSENRKRNLGQLSFRLKELKKHFESQFVTGMSWDNYATVWQARRIKSFPELSDPQEWTALKNLKSVFCHEAC